MKNFNIDEVESILNNEKKLKSLVPQHAYDSNYKYLFENHYDWYCVVMGLSSNLTDSKKRASKMGFDFNLKLSDLTDLWIKQQGRCCLTGQILSFKSGSREDKNPFRASIDRINNNKGYVKGNVRLLTHWANNAKSTWDDHCFEQFVKSSAQQILLG